MMSCISAQLFPHDVNRVFYVDFYYRRVSWTSAASRSVRWWRRGRSWWEVFPPLRILRNTRQILCCLDEGTESTESDHVPGVNQSGSVNSISGIYMYNGMHACINLHSCVCELTHMQTHTYTLMHSCAQTVRKEMWQYYQYIIITKYLHWWIHTTQLIHLWEAVVLTRFDKKCSSELRKHCLLMTVTQ